MLCNVCLVSLYDFRFFKMFFPSGVTRPIIVLFQALAQALLNPRVL